MQSLLESSGSRKRRRLNNLEAGPYVLRPILDKISLTNDEYPGPVSITCVEFWNDNLYIGTSASEILHFVALPSDPEDDSNVPTFIPASRLHPSGYGSPAPSSQPPGVRQILVLPGPLKACVLCNGVVSFYTLPEFTPTFPNREPAGVQWIGGVDEDESLDNPEGPVVMIANSKRILQVRVGEKLRPIKNNIEYPGCLRSSRRGSIACVADKSAYSLLEIEHQQKQPLFPISSTNISEEDEIAETRPLPDISSSSRGAQPARRDQVESGHGRSTSLGTFVSSYSNRQPSPHLPDGDRRSLRPPEVDGGGRGSTSPPKAVPTASDSDQGKNTLANLRYGPRSSTDAIPSPTSARQPPTKSSFRLHPHILSPSSTEFLLTTGIGEGEPGVGMFVNLDGDAVRGTIEFERYPETLSIDTPNLNSDTSLPSNPGGQGEFIFALMKRPVNGSLEVGLEIQSLSMDDMTARNSKSWLSLSTETTPEGTSCGLSRSLSSHSYNFKEVGELLGLVRLKLGSQSTPPLVDSDPRTKASVERVEGEKALFETSPESTNTDWAKERSAEESRLALRLGNANSWTMAWSGNSLWQVVRNPEVLQLELSICAGVPVDDQTASLNSIHIPSIKGTLRRIRDREPQTEVEFLTLNYIRQKSSLMMFIDVLRQAEKRAISEESLRDTEKALLDGGLDPRVFLILVPIVQFEVQQGPQGIWIPRGLAEIVADRANADNSMDEVSLEFWLMLRHLLSAWQEKRGYASITDEKLVFDSVDASLLVVLLHLDQSTELESGQKVAARTKLNNVVDHWKGDFDRAVFLLERFHRLFVLSRLYQSRKLANKVLETWKRIADGELDRGSEISPASVEVQVRGYLVNLRNASLVEEYSLWLALRNPDLAIQFLTDDAAKVKFTPQQVTSLLKENAPGAVQLYLEHLVFNKHLDQYADDLIGYYLDSVINVLENSEEARESLAQSYSTYRALEKPKPTYLNFIIANAPGRLVDVSSTPATTPRSGSYATSSTSKDLTYSIPKVLERLAPFSAYLVSESIILDARQGRHKEAIHLLTHGLGDYDTAIRYCYFGGPTAASAQPVDPNSLPAVEVQMDLFAFLFEEFLAIDDPAECVERTGDLLGKFAAWFDPLSVLGRLPDSWSVDALAEFLLRTFRAMTSQRNEAVVLKALSAAQNLQRQVEFVEACEKMGMRIEESQGSGVQIHLRLRV